MSGIADSTDLVQQFAAEVRGWADVSAHAHRFGGTEFRYGRAEIGHIHREGTLDIPFPRAIRDELLARGAAEEHHFVPDSGWATFRMRREADLQHGLWLMRISYLRHALKHADEAGVFFEREADALHLDAKLRELLARFVPASASHA
jgi:hypothetical protein